MRPKKCGPISPLVQILWGAMPPPPCPPLSTTLPKTQRYIQSFCSFCRKSINSFSDLVKPLSDLAKRYSHFVWGQGCKSGFFIGGGGDNRSKFTKICILTSLGGTIFQLSKNPLKSKRKLSNFQFHVRQQC